MDPIPSPNPSDVLSKSLLRAAKALGLNHREVGAIIGRDRSTIERNGVDPDSKPGELALLLIRIYRSLFALMGGDHQNMRHFLQTPNHGTGGTPGRQLYDVQGLVTVCTYLDALRGKA